MSRSGGVALVQLAAWLALAGIAAAGSASEARAEETNTETFESSLGSEGDGGAETSAADLDEDDCRAMLRNCDERLQACETDVEGMPYLAGAYMGLWALLLGFLLWVRRGQRRLRDELEELRARLREAEGEAR